jgi:superfamily II RNA helicase
MSQESYLDVVPNDRVVDLKDPAITYPFELDNFQKLAQYYIQHDENVMITAHTSAGKTVVAEAAIAYAKRLGKRTFYTSPIKTLSNQKYSEFTKKFGECGLLTGDIKCNPDAQCVVMTTEILRDMLQKPQAFSLENVHSIIFDEVHYVNNPDRGHVWEQCFIQLPANITLVLLSATISEAEKFAQWIGKLKKRPIHLITTLKRPVPLNHYAYADDKLHLILDNFGQFYDQNYHLYSQIVKKPTFNSNNLLNPFVQFLKTQKLYPAIFFVFSRKRCQTLANNVTIGLIDKSDQAKIANEIDYHLNQHAVDKTTLDRLPQIIETKRLLTMGIGVHHSGLLPILKEITEILFSKGLIKLLFATETFAVGVNMPTRTVIFTELQKYCDGSDQPRMLKPDEYLQMSGRAGRRGLDQFGTVIHLPMTEAYPISEIRKLLLGKSAQIESKFKVNYAYVLHQISKNMIKTHESDASPDDSPDASGSSDSYLFEQNIELVEKLRQQSIELSEKMAKLSSELEQGLNISQLESFGRLDDLEQQLIVPASIGNFSVKINKSQEKRIKSEIQTILKSFSPDQLRLRVNATQHRQYQREIEQINSQVDNYQQQLNRDYVQCQTELIHLGYLDDRDSTISLTTKGVIATHIITADEILVTELLNSDEFHELDLPSLSAVLSLFCDNSRSSNSQEKKKSIVSDQASAVINWIYDVGEQCESSMQFRGRTCEILNDTFANVAYLWANGSSYFEILPYLETFEGNFIRNMLKLSHICDEIIKVCEVFEWPILEKKLVDLKAVIVRDLVTPDSLYLKI